MNQLPGFGKWLSDICPVFADDIERRKSQFLQIGCTLRITSHGADVVHTRTAVVIAGNIQFPGDKSVFDSSLAEQFCGFVQPRKSDTDGSARIHAEDVAVAKYQDGEFSIDLPADVIFPGWDLMRDTVSIQWLHATTGQTPVFLHLGEQTGIRQGGGRRSSIISEQNFDARFVQPAHASVSAGVSTGAFNSRSEKWRIRAYLSP